MSRDYRFGSLDQDEEDTYQLPIRLKKEIKDSQLPSQLPSKSAAPSHGVFELGTKMQFGAGNYKSNLTAAFASEASPWVEAGKDQAKKAVYHTETPSGKVPVTLTAFLAHVRAARCSTCGEEFFSSKFDVSTMLSKWRENEGKLDPLVPISSVLTSR